MKRRKKYRKARNHCGRSHRKYVKRKNSGKFNRRRNPEAEPLLALIRTVEPKAHVTYHHPHGSRTWGEHVVHVFGRELSGYHRTRDAALRDAVERLKLRGSNPKRTKHLPSCEASHMTFGGYCLNCGLGAPPKGKKPSRASRIAHLKTMGFKFPRKKGRNGNPRGQTPYDELTIVPTIIADQIVGNRYTGQELSAAQRDSRMVDRIEFLRSKMTTDRKRAFIEAVDARCRAAYKAKAPWFMKIARSKTNTGRDQLYAFISHWLASDLNKEGHGWRHTF